MNNDLGPDVVMPRSAFPITSIIHAGILALGLITAVFGAGMLFAFQDYQDAVKRERFAHGITTATYQLIALSGEYLLHGTDRTKIQWRNAHRTLGGILSDPSFSAAKANEALRRFSRLYDKAGKMFLHADRMVDTNGNGKSIKSNLASHRRLKAQLLTDTQAMGSHASQFARSNQLILDQIGNRTSWFVAAYLVVLAVSFLGLWLVLRLRVIGPIRNLEANIVALDDGQLENDIQVERADEIGAVAAAFNQMTDQLRNSLVSRDALVEEVAERRRAEEAAEAAQARLTEIFIIAPEAVITIGADMMIQLFNNGAERIFGYRSDEVLGKPLNILIPEHLHSVHGHHVEAFSRSGDEYRHMKQRDDIVGKRKDGTEFPASASVSKLEIRGELIFTVMLQDISVRKEAQRALAESEERFRSVFDNAPASIALKNLDGRFELVNPVYETFFNTRADEVLGKTSSELYAPEIAARLESHDRQILSTGKVTTQEIEVSRPELPINFVRVTKFPVFDETGEVAGIGTFTTDISAEKIAEDQLRQAQKMEAVGQLTGGVAHDFNNILAAIIGNLDLLQDEDDLADDFARQGIAIALRAALRGAELTDRLLAFSRRQELDAKATNVNDLLQEFRSLAERTIGADVAIRMELAAGLWPTMVDAGQLENALLNLAINARDAMPNGGQIIIETANRVLLDGEQTFEDLVPGDYVMIAVSDNGTGMPADLLERAFEPFFTTKEVGEGSGLGLSMVFGFVKQSGGQISISSEVDNGTIVRIYLPRTRVIADAKGGGSEPKQDRPSGHEKILVVEDNEDLLAYLVSALGGLGYTVLQAENGPVALEVMDSSGDIDLLLTDVVLPLGMNGRDIADTFRERYPEAGVVYSSGYTREALNSRGRFDVDSILIRKPFQTQDLAEQVRQALDCKGAQD